MGGMKRRLLALLTALLGLALAAPPAYPENTAGLGYAHPAQGALFLSAGLPFTPLGLDTGAALELAVGNGVRGALDLGVLAFPGLTAGNAYLDLGGYLRLPFAYASPGGLGLGVALGPRVGLEIEAGLPLTLTGSLGLGFGPGFFLDYAAGLRAYLEPVALDLGYDRTLGLYAGLLYLW